MERIEKFEDLIKDYIGSEKTIFDTKITNLTAPGENYMSEILKIDVILKNKNITGANENLHLVAKLVTEHEFLGPTSNLNKNELAFYQEIIPCIKSFHERHGLPYPRFFPEFIGGRINLTGGDEPDKKGVIVLENLIEQGYENLDRHVGFDLKTTKLILDDLATFHAVPLAMKLLEPETFEAKIKANCLGIQIPMPKSKPNIENEPGKTGASPQDTKGPGFLDSPPIIFIRLLEMLKREEQYSQVALKFEHFLKKIKERLKTDPSKIFNKQPVEPFYTLAHCDMWINNTMQLLKDGVPIKNKFVDFQMYQLGSPVHDLVFFLFSSVEISCLRQDLDNLFKYYYNTFSNVLKNLNCYGPQFSYDNFLEEVKTGAHGSIGQCLFMLATVIFVKKGQTFDNEKSRAMTIEDMPSVAKEKLILLCVEASNRDWF